MSISATPPSASLRADERRASLSLVLSATFFAAMALLARVVSPRVPGPQIAVVRFAAGLFVVLIAWRLLRLDLRPHRLTWLVARGLFGGIAVLAYFTCIERVGVGIATLLNYTAPVYALLFGWLLLGERPRAAAVVGLVLTLAGVALVVGVDLRASRAGGWELVGVLSAVASGMATTSIRAVRRHGPDGAGEGSWTVFASFTTLGLLTTLPAALGPWGAWVAPSAGDWALLLAVAGISIAAQLVMTRALRHVTATAMGIIHQLTVVLALGGGILFFGETLSPRAALGSVLTMAGVIGLILFG